MTDPSGIDQDLVKRAMQMPLLTPDEEQALGQRVLDSKGTDQAAIQALVGPHLRLVIANSKKFRHYNLPQRDLMQEGVIGLMQAASRFDPTRNTRFATYAQWWIRSTMTEFVLRNWSMIRLGTTRGQKSLFFNLRRLRLHIDGMQTDAMSPSTAAQISTVLNVPVEDVHAMEQRLSARDTSLNVTPGDDGGEDRGALLVSNLPNPEEETSATQLSRMRMDLVMTALSQLPERERHIIEMRRLHDPALTLEQVGAAFGVSKERIRQLEHRAMAQIRLYLRTHSQGAADLLD